jgi:hypothetical protein
MAQAKAKLDHDIHLPVPFDLIYGGQREVVKVSALLKLTPDYAAADPLVSNNRLRLYIGDVLRYEGHSLGGVQFGELRKTDKGKFEVWLDPRYVNRYSEA